MSMAIKRLSCLLLLIGLTGCGQIAVLYSNTVVPYSHEFENVPVGSKSCTINDYKLRDPVSGYSLSAEWTTRKIMEEAHKAGISRIDYIDRRTLNILFGIYRRESFIVYGD